MNYLGLRQRGAEGVSDGIDLRLRIGERVSKRRPEIRIAPATGVVAKIICLLLERSTRRLRRRDDCWRVGGGDGQGLAFVNYDLRETAGAVETAHGRLFHSERRTVPCQLSLALWAFDAAAFRGFGWRGEGFVGGEGGHLDSGYNTLSGPCGVDCTATALNIAT